MKNKNTKDLVLAAMFLALGLVLPFFAGQIKEIGNMLLPMHIPVILCGLICSWQYGLAVGFITPLLRSMLFSMPIMYPSAVAMAFELATYGAVAGFLYKRAKWQCVKMLYKCLAAAMITGRVVWGIMMLILVGVKGNLFSVQAFIGGAFLNAIPGIILQLVVIPAVMVALNRAKLVKFHKHK